MREPGCRFTTLQTLSWLLLGLATSVVNPVTVKLGNAAASDSERHGSLEIWGITVQIASGILLERWVRDVQSLLCFHGVLLVGILAHLRFTLR